MADYRELLRRAVDALPENNGTSRRAVYEKAREALVTQLRAIDPPLPAREITQHRLTLEDCIRQVEQEATEALLQGLKQQTEAHLAPVVTPEMAPVPPAAEVPEIEVETAQEDGIAKAIELAEQSAPAEQADIVEPDAPEEVEPDLDVESSADDLVAALQETIDPADDNSNSEQHFADIDAEEVEEAATDVEAEAPALPSEVDVVEEPEHVVTEDRFDVVIVNDEDEKELESEAEKTEAAETEEVAPQVPSTPQIVEPTQPEPVVKADDAEKPEPIRNSIDDVIAAAQAASNAAAIVPPKVDVQAPAQSTAAEASAHVVQPALSSVREVEVDEELAASAINIDGDEPQATIDRAIKALDMEAEGKDTGSKVPENKTAGDTQGDKQAVVEPAANKNFDDLTDAQIVEDEETGGNGLLVFLLLVVLLLVGAGGGAYWAWKEGYVDLNPLMSQIGLGTQTSTTQTPTATTNTETPTTEGTNVQSNVRDVSPTTSTPELTEPTTEQAPVEETSSEPVVSEQLTPEPVVPTTEGSDTTNTGDEATATEVDPAASTDERLVAEQAEGDTTQPQLNVGETSATSAQVGSRSLLIEEQLSGNSGAVPFSGETVWSRDVDELGAPVIKALVSVPARNLTVDVLFRKNSDPALPASHLVEVNFSVTESFLGGGIASLPGILLKDQELAQGDPLIGASARIFDNSFLFALSASEADLAKNLSLISERGWVDLPVVYSTGRKAIVTLEKGKDGGAIFEAVLAAWATE